MLRMPQSNRLVRPPLVPILAGLAVAVCLGLLALRDPGAGLRGDEGTYVAMASSLARDHDFTFDGADRAWAETHQAGPVALILQRTASGVRYSKPVVYPLIAAPFVGLLGDWGAALCNLVVLGLALAVARAALLRLGPAERVRDTLQTFAGTGVVLPYVAWRMTETLQVALAVAGLALAMRFPESRTPPRGWAERLLARPLADLLGGALLGLLVSLREPNALVAIVPIAAAVLARDLRRALRVTAGVAGAYGAAVLLTWALLGAANPYKAVRATFNAETGYPAGADAQAALARFGDPDKLATSSLELQPLFDASKSAFATIYFFVGRHTGVVPFLPAALVLLLAALRRRGSRTWAALGGFAALALFYLIWMPVNFFGGETFLGNRYILAAYPCLLFALTELPSRRLLLAAWAIAGAVGLSALASEVRYGALDATSQSHTNAGIFRWLPYESTASNLDGRRDRYWGGDFVRFVDPFPAVGPWSFTISSDRPAAELEVATRFPTAPMNFVAVADGLPATLVISDWKSVRRYPLAPFSATRAGGAIAHLPASAWRSHPFWWSPEAVYAVRLLRIGVETEGRRDGPPVGVRLRYLGRTLPPETAFRRESAPVELPSVVAPGEKTIVKLQVKNAGDWTWNSAAVVPVQVGLRLEPIGPASGLSVEPRFELPRPIAPGERFELALPIEWPREPGRYRVILDLVAEDVAWFGDRVGAPLASAEVEVRVP